MKTGLFVGLAGLDFVYVQDDIPNNNSKSKTNDYRVCVGGPATNAAIAFTLLGGKSILVSCIGNSPYGQCIKDQLMEYDIKVLDGIETLKTIPNISSITVNPKTGSRTIWSGQQKIDKEIIVNCDNELEQADFCLFDCNQIEISLPVLEKAHMLRKEIVLDAGSWKQHMPHYIKKASVAIASSSCIPPVVLGDFISFSKLSGVKKIAVTDGENPIIWQDEYSHGTITPLKVNAIDTLGAGDVFHGAYCYFSFEKNLCFANALENASIIASKSVEHYGVESIKDFSFLC